MLFWYDKMIMKPKTFYWLFVLILVFSVKPAEAYYPLLNDKEKPYEITPVADRFEVGLQYLGELKDYPQTYELIVKDEKELTVSLLQHLEKEINPLSLIVVRENDKGGGVSEIGRIDGKETDWQREKPENLGLTFMRSEELSATLKSGTYRIEVSSPDNVGKYVLAFSSFELSEGYFQEVKNVMIFQKFFGLSIFSLAKSKYIFLPFGIIAMIYGFLRIKRAKKLKNA